MYLEVTIKGTGSRLSVSSLIKLLFSNLLLIQLASNPTQMYVSDLRVYFKQEVYFGVTEVGWRSTKKLVDYANTTNVEFIVDPKVLFHG